MGGREVEAKRFRTSILNNINTWVNQYRFGRDLMELRLIISGTYIFLN